jgi:CheY-like chemotaxis protein
MALGRPTFEAHRTVMPTKPSILVVDDSADSREMLAEYLRFRGFEISDATDGEQAIAVARDVRPDMILMDLSMPGIDGWEATRQLKADPLTRHAVIIAVSAHAFPPARQAAKNAGCDAFILKPYDLTVLADTLHEVTTKGPAAFEATRLTHRQNRSSGVGGS